MSRPQIYVPRRLVVAPRLPAAVPDHKTARDDAPSARAAPTALNVPKARQRPTGRSPQKKLLYALTVVFLLGGTVFLTSLKSNRQPVGHVAAQQVAVAKPALPAAKPASVSIGLPLRLRIPKIGVDAAVNHVGLTPKGDMDTPKGPDTVGWFNPGPRPGEVGNAVIDGHFGWKNNLPAVFDNLHTLQKDDPVIVEGENGNPATFIVRELRTYGREETATDVFRSSDGKAHLNLITCQGVWNERQKSYSNRLVVLTDLLVDADR